MQAIHASEPIFFVYVTLGILSVSGGDTKTIFLKYFQSAFASQQLEVVPSESDNLRKDNSWSERH